MNSKLFEFRRYPFLNTTYLDGSHPVTNVSLVSSTLIVSLGMTILLCRNCLLDPTNNLQPIKLGESATRIYPSSSI